MRKVTGPLILTAVALCLLLAFILYRTLRPFYGGHSLSYWLKHSESEQAATAIRAIGTNAIPQLLRWLSQEIPTSNVKLPSGEVLKMGDVSRIEYALFGFQILGTNAAPALPALVRLLKDKTYPPNAIAAAGALASIGEPGLPYLTAALSDTNQLYRDNIVTSISTMPIFGVATNACLEPLLKATTDADESVRVSATNALRKLAPQLLTSAAAK